MLIVAGLVLAVGGRAWTADKEEARATIDRAIKATGGEEKLTKFKALTFKEKGTYYGGGEAQAYTGEYGLQLPDQFRMDITRVFVSVLDGDKGWIQRSGETKEMTKEELAEAKESQYARRVERLTPLKDEAFTLSPLDEIKVNDRAAVGVKVSQKGHRDIKLYFDRESGQLVRSEQRVKNESGKEVTQEATFSDYKEVEGIKVPTKIVINRDGKKFVEAEVQETKVLQKLDDKLFQKP